MATTTLFTIGYAGKDIRQFVQILHQVRISTLVDVRQLPLSRKRDFSKSNLQAHLNQSGIEYKHIGVLGSPKTLRDKIRKDDNYHSFFKGYHRYLKTHRDVVNKLSNEVSQKTSCLMCVESDPAQCHRQIIVQTIKAQYPKLRINHL